LFFPNIFFHFLSFLHFFFFFSPNHWKMEDKKEAAGKEEAQLLQNIELEKAKTERRSKREERGESLRLALQSVKKRGLRGAARLHGFPYSTLKHHWKKDPTAIDNYTGGRHSKLPKWVERRLADWVDEMVNRGFTVTFDMIKKKVILIDPTLKASNRWFYNGLRKRNPFDFVLRRVQSHSLTRSRAGNPVVVGRWIEFIAGLIEKYEIKPQNLYNMDETGFELNDTRGLTLCRKGRKIVHATTNPNREHITLCICVNAAGGHMEPFYVFQGKRKPKKLNLNPNLFFMTESGFVTKNAWKALGSIIFTEFRGQI